MKQAYLIIAHQDDLTFRTLISMLDDDNNDIFIHMDKKNKAYEKAQVEKIAKKSTIYHTERTNVTWGGTAKSMQKWFCCAMRRTQGTIITTIC